MWAYRLGSSCSGEIIWSLLTDTADLSEPWSLQSIQPLVCYPAQYHTLKAPDRESCVYRTKRAETTPYFIFDVSCGVEGDSAPPRHSHPRNWYHRWYVGTYPGIPGNLNPTLNPGVLSIFGTPKLCSINYNAAWWPAEWLPYIDALIKV